jgi:hypothetical protein
MKVHRGYRIDDDVWKKVKHISMVKNVPESTIVNEALKEYVAKYTGEPTLQKAFERIEALEEKVKVLEETLNMIKLKYEGETL